MIDMCLSVQVDLYKLYENISLKTPIFQFFGR